MLMKLSGEYRSDPWAAVLLAQYEFRKGGSITRLLIPPAAVHAITAPKTYAKIEVHAAYKLPSTRAGSMRPLLTRRTCRSPSGPSRSKRSARS